jgi:hypothetical protein
VEPWIVMAAAATLVAPLVLRTPAGHRRRGLVVAGIIVVLVGGAGLSREPPDRLPESLPGPVLERGFATSDRCRACHPEQYRSWHDSYHRTMTQAATPAAVLGDFADVVLRDRSRRYELTRDGDAFIVDMVDPLWEMQHRGQPFASLPKDPPRTRARVLMTTGSHHLQTYWIRRPDTNGVYYQMPWVWYRGEQRWVPSQDSFLAPPVDRPDGIQTWNTTCTICHTVVTEPRMIEGAWTVFSASAELGIACEACHGPADEHVRWHQAPHRRYARHLAGAPDPTIVNPADLDPKRATQVCGQCHSFGNERDMEAWKLTGIRYRAGEDLEETRNVYRYSAAPTDPQLLGLLGKDPHVLEGTFWKDGTIRVAGREYNGLLESACHQRGAMTCLSCHSLHRYVDPEDQLASSKTVDASCRECHPGLAAEHTHHAPESAGSSCQNCHMPHTTYGLFAAMRSHRIDSPSAANTARTGRPNACNQCHLDRSLAWTARWLTEWYGQPAVAVEGDHATVSMTLLHALSGDAAQRAIAAWTMGWADARQASGQRWLPYFLAPLLDDPYPVVRQVAYRSLRRLPGYGDFRFDFLGDAPARARAQLEVVQRFRAAGAPDRSGTAVLLDERGQAVHEDVLRLLNARDDRPVSIIE